MKQKDFPNSKINPFPCFLTRFLLDFQPYLDGQEGGFFGYTKYGVSKKKLRLCVLIPERERKTDRLETERKKIESGRNRENEDIGTEERIRL